MVVFDASNSDTGVGIDVILTVTSDSSFRTSITIASFVSSEVGILSIMKKIVDYLS